MTASEPTLFDVDALQVDIQSPTGEWLPVGRLERNDESNWFWSYSEYWATDERPLLGQVFEERGPGWRPSARVSLPTWFSHLLPEGRLRQAIASAADVNELREFFLLARIGGDDLPGAVRVLAADREDRSPQLDEEITDDLDEDNVLKFSLAGVQLKFSLARDAERGLTIPARGQAGDWIAKLPDHRPGFEHVPESELAGLELARRSGIDVPAAELVEVRDIAGLPDWASDPGGRALLVERFDRRGRDQRVHTEEIAQVLGISTGHHLFKYRRTNLETIASVAAGICGVEAVGPVIDRIVLNVLLGNGDAHAKNWALRYPDGRNAELAPAYDLVPTVLYIPQDDLGLKLRNSREFNDVHLRSFDRLGSRCGWSVQETHGKVNDAIDRVTSAWGVLADLLPKESFDFLTTRRDALPLLRS